MKCEIYECSEESKESFSLCQKHLDDSAKDGAQIHYCWVCNRIVDITRDEEEKKRKYVNVVNCGHCVEAGRIVNG